MASTVPTEVHCRPSPNLLLEYSIYQLSFWSRILLSPFLADVFLWRRLQVRCISPVNLVGQLSTLGPAYDSTLGTGFCPWHTGCTAPQLGAEGLIWLFHCCEFLEFKSHALFILVFQAPEYGSWEETNKPWCTCVFSEWMGPFPSPLKSEFELLCRNSQVKLSWVQIELKFVSHKI